LLCSCAGTPPHPLEAQAQCADRDEHRDVQQQLHVKSHGRSRQDAEVRRSRSAANHPDRMMPGPFQEVTVTINDYLPGRCHVY
jgi:hypothetical protein